MTNNNLPTPTLDHSTQNAILQRIRLLLDTAWSRMSQAEIARRMGMDPSNLSKYLNRKTPVNRALINRLTLDMGVSRQWLLQGEGNPFDDDSAPAPVRMANGTPVYDIDVTAGCSPLERMFTTERITGYVDLPDINPGSVIVRVSGDSMEPKIINGGFVAIRPIKSADYIFWGQTYVIVMEDYRMVKVLRRHPLDDNMVILHSVNPEYDDMDIRRDDIQALFLVETIINCRTLC